MDRRNKSPAPGDGVGAVVMWANIRLPKKGSNVPADPTCTDRGA